MSACINAGQTLSRGLKLYSPRNPRNPHSLSFLYQTATLRRYHIDLHNSRERTSQRHARSLEKSPSGPKFQKSNTAEEFLPFESPKDTQIRRPERFQKSRSPSKFQKPKIQEDFVPFESAEGTESNISEKPSTITGNERKVFDRLESLAATMSQELNRQQKSEKESFSSLDDLLNEAVSNIKSKSRKTSEESGLRRKNNQPSIFRKIDNSGIHRKSTLAGLRQQNADHFLALIRAAKTDVEVWSVLENEVFDRVAALNLDQTTAEDTSVSNSAMEKETKRIAMFQFPRQLTLAAVVLRLDFPDSHLILSLIPKIRSMGPSVYALGASPKLYNQVIAFLFEKYTDIDGINDLLDEMEREVIEPDSVTLRLLNHIDEFRWGVHHGSYGQAIRSIWATEQYRRSFEMLARWKVRVEKLVREQEVRIAKDKKAKEDSEFDDDDGDDENTEHSLEMV